MASPFNGKNQDNQGEGGGSGRFDDDGIGKPGNRQENTNGTGDADHLKGTNNADFILGLGGDDLILGRKGNDVLDGDGGDDDISGQGGVDQIAGGAGADHLSGGAMDDLLVGGGWTDTVVNGMIDAGDTFVQDDDTDHYQSESTFAANGEDTIWFYDDDATGSGVFDVIDLTKALDLVDTIAVDGSVSVAELNAAFFYNEATGELETAGAPAEDWFTVYEDAGGDVADTVWVEFDGDQFMWNTGTDSWDAV